MNTFAILWTLFTKHHKYSMLKNVLYMLLQLKQYHILLVGRLSWA